MAKRKERSFGQVIRERRRQLDLTQHEVARRIKTSTPYVGHLEAGKRHPSDRVLVKLAEVLGLDQRELFFLANPGAVDMLKLHSERESQSGWEEFRKDDRLKRLHGITHDEMEMLSKVALMGQISSPRDFIYILNTVRHVLGR
jgi:transcriptional regulator with XRE-family HTH domain